MISNDDTYSKNDTNIQTTGDNICSVEEQQGAIFGQLPVQNKTVKYLSASKLNNLMDQIPGIYSLFCNQVKKTIKAIVSSFNEMSITDSP